MQISKILLFLAFYAFTMGGQGVFAQCISDQGVTLSSDSESSNIMVTSNSSVSGVRLDVYDLKKSVKKPRIKKENLALRRREGVLVAKGLKPSVYAVVITQEGCNPKVVSKIIQLGGQDED